MLGSSRVVRVHLADPDFEPGEFPLKFTLTYAGPLKTGGKGRIGRIHDIRRQFHPQLRRLWKVNKLLSNWHVGARHGPVERVLDTRRSTHGAYSFVSLVTKAADVDSALEFHILRPSDVPGELPDLDNQVKVLCDALTMPWREAGSGELPAPSDDESPFFTLLEDDSLVSRIVSTNDELLAPVNGKSTIDMNDVMVSVNVHVRPQFPTTHNVIFFADDNDVWDHPLLVPNDFRDLSSRQLRAVAAQCVLRIRMLSEAFESWKARDLADAIRDRRYVSVTQENLILSGQTQNILWRDELRPKAVAIKRELQRRVFGDPPYPRDFKSVAIEDGILAGPSPLGDAAEELESLIQQLL